MKVIPHNHPVKVAWNILMLVAIQLFLIRITYQVIFKTFHGGLFYYTLIGLFIADIGITFCTSVKKGYITYETRTEIQKKYISGAFIIDLISAIPFEIILLAFFSTVEPGTHAFNFYLIIQSLTLIKLLKVKRLFGEIQEALAILPAVRRLVFFGYALTSALHIMVIGWILIGASEQFRPPIDQYLRGLYWAITTIATIGYGDYGPDHNSNVQIIYTIIVQVFGVGMFSYVIANVSSLISNLDIARSAYQQRLEEVNSYMRSQHIPSELQHKVRDYYSYLWEKQKGVDVTSALEDIPNGLAQEIRMFLNRDMLSKVPIFKEANDLFLRESVRLMKPQIFLPGEYIIRQGEFADCMYFLTSGDVRIVINDAEVARLGPGSPFGETALITNQFRNASVISESYGTGYRLIKADFDILRSKYPEFDRQVEKISQLRR
ncbi:MAG TPA: cyclic nucleotide-binding domain-containing protein [Treponemataceae bacterium]|nr:cyclic nucleotide-binding domain-containing protein [Treponemataceae bacterium]